MARLIINNKEYEISDGTPIAEVCEKAGIPFSCNSGVCGTCQIDILEGADNLDQLNQEEKDLAMTRTHRLCCQCKILQGTVKLSF